MTHSVENDALRLVQVTGKCPHCDVRKHQIDSTQERAVQIVSDAIARHIREAHPRVTPSEVSAP